MLFILQILTHPSEDLFSKTTKQTLLVLSILSHHPHNEDHNISGRSLTSWSPLAHGHDGHIMSQVSPSARADPGCWLSWLIPRKASLSPPGRGSGCREPRHWRLATTATALLNTGKYEIETETRLTTSCRVLLALGLKLIYDLLLNTVSAGLSHQRRWCPWSPEAGAASPDWA